MVGVQQENGVHGFGQDRVHLVLFTGVAEHHVQEVLGVAEIVARVHEGLTDGVFVGHGRQGGHFRHQANCRDFAMLFVRDIQRIVVEGGQGAHDAAHDGHRVSIAAETFEKGTHLVVDHGVTAHGAVKGFFFLLVRQFSVKQQVAGFQEVRLLCELLNRITAVQQHPLATIDVSDFGLAGCGGDEAWVIGEVAFARQRTYFDYVWTDST